MDKRSTQLERRLFAALKCAMAEDRQDVAEHLLCALELLCGGEIEGTTLGKAYLTLAKHKQVASQPQQR